MPNTKSPQRPRISQTKKSSSPRARKTIRKTKVDVQFGGSSKSSKGGTAPLALNITRKAHIKKRSTMKKQKIDRVHAAYGVIPPPPKQRERIATRIRNSIFSLKGSPLTNLQETKQNSSQETTPQSKSKQKYKNGPPQKSVVARYCGRLWMRVVAGRKLDAKDRGGTSDPYVDIHVGEKHVRTEIVEKTLTPKWQENEFLFKLDTRRHDIIFNVWDYDMIGFDDFMGQVKIPCHTVQEGQIDSRWHTLQKRDGHKRDKVSGEIHIMLCFLPIGIGPFNVLLPSISPKPPVKYGSVQDLLDSEDQIEWGLFRKVVNSQYCPELTNFYDRIRFLREKIRKGKLTFQSEQGRKLCDSIYHKYVKDGAPEEINISAKEKKHLKGWIYKTADETNDNTTDTKKNSKELVVRDDISNSVFDEANHEILDLLQKNFYQKYASSKDHAVADQVKLWVSGFNNFVGQDEMKIGAIQALIDKLKPEQREKLTLR
eukprot:g439.t1